MNDYLDQFHTILGSPKHESALPYNCDNGLAIYFDYAEAETVQAEGFDVLWSEKVLVEGVEVCTVSYLRQKSAKYRWINHETGKRYANSAHAAKNCKAVKAMSARLLAELLEV